jgi:predicted nucleic acid-binding protein
MRAYIDTSLLVSLYVGEQQEVLDAHSSFNRLGQHAQIFIAATTPLEWESAIWLRWRMRQVAESDAKEIIQLIDMQCISFTLLELTLERLEISKLMIAKYRTVGLRPLDAMQLACACAMSGKLDVVLTRDLKLATCFRAEGFTVWPD